jgi:hypothetical protein
MTLELAVILSVFVLILGGALFALSEFPDGSNNRFFAFIGSAVKFNLDRFDKAGHFKKSGSQLDEFSPKIILISCALVILFGGILNKFYDQFAYGNGYSFLYSVDVRHDYERARSDLAQMKLELAYINQFSARQKNPEAASGGDGDIVKCEEVRIRQLGLQAELVRLRGNLARVPEKSWSAPESRVPLIKRLEQKLESLSDEISNLSRVCSRLGKISSSFSFLEKR